jgi:hypothetical protein
MASSKPQDCMVAIPYTYKNNRTGESKTVSDKTQIVSFLGNNSGKTPRPVADLTQPSVQERLEAVSA